MRMTAFRTKDTVEHVDYLERVIDNRMLIVWDNIQQKERV